MLYDELTQPGSYICHHGVKGQKWGVRHDKTPSYRKLTKEEKRLSGMDFDGDDPYRNAKKQRHKDYRIAKKEAYKEYKKKLKESGVNNFFIKSRAEAVHRENELDEWAIAKGHELFEQYKNMKIADAMEKGKTLRNLGQIYFHDYRATPSGTFWSTEPAIVNYQYLYNPEYNETTANKSVQRYYTVRT